MKHKIDNHECFQKLVERIGSDATFEKTWGSYHFEDKEDAKSDQEGI